MRKEGKREREREREGEWASGCRRRGIASVMFHGSCWDVVVFSQIGLLFVREKYEMD